MGRKKSNNAYKYFELIDKNKAECQICQRVLLSQHGSNLLKHLMVHHDDAYADAKQLNDQAAAAKGEVTGVTAVRKSMKRRRSSSPDVIVKQEASVEEEEEETVNHETVKSSDIWNYFEAEGRRAHCLICDIVTENGYNDLKGHLIKHHPNIMLKLAQDQSDDEDGGNEEAYTEIVYLEQDPIQSSRPKAPEKAKSTPQRKSIKIEKTPVKRVRIDSEKCETENPELDAFINYITCLLKKMSPEVFAKVQIDILNDIMNAPVKYNDTQTSTSSNVANNSFSTVTEKIDKLSELVTETVENVE